jgi:uncharacterized damage-inducible protein DinB
MAGTLYLTTSKASFCTRTKGTAVPASEIELLLQIIDEGYNKKAWHGPNLRGSIRGISFSQAAWRPAPDRHNIWENVVHAAYWKYIVRRRLLGEKRGSFSLKGSNWFVRPMVSEARAWLADLALLDEMHRTMRAAVAGLDSKDLRRVPVGSKVSNAAIISGIAAHDVYHAGQIQLLKRLSGEAAAVDGKNANC